MQLYKVLNGRDACNGGSARWRLRRWMPPIKGELVPCSNGYHLCREQDLIYWLGPNIFKAEHRGELVEDQNKVVVREARIIRELNWNDRKARLFACDCAERVLHLFEKSSPTDKRPRECIEVSRRFALGEATKQELWDAGTAARTAAGDAAGTAARTAAGDAAWDAAGSAARTAAGATAWTAARTAAGDAAWDAARAVAGDATGDAAWDAEWTAAWDAEREWQTGHLMQYLTGETPC